MDEVTSLGVSVDTRGARSSVRGLRTDLDRLTDSGERASAQSAILSRTLVAAGSALAAYAGTQSVSRLVADAARLESINARISSLTGDLAGSQTFLRNSAAELSAEYTVLADGYSRLLPLFKAGVLSLDQAQEITKGLANVQAQTGASSADLGRSIFGLAQGLSAGTLRAEELNQVTEALPGLLQELDKAAGLAGGGFRRLVIEGKVTSDFFRDTLQVALKNYEGAAAALSGNITQAFNRTKNAYTDLLEDFAQPINDNVTGFANSATEALEFLGENADSVALALQAVGTAGAVAIGGAAIRGLTSYASALSTVSTRATALRAVQQGALGTANLEVTARLAAAQAANRSAQATLAETQATAAALPIKQRAAFVDSQVAAARSAAQVATTNLVAAETAAVAATGRLTAAQRVNAIAAGAMATAQRGAAAALSLVGGPAGVALIAAGGLAFLLTRQNEAQQSAEALKEAVDELNESYFSNEQAARNAGEAQLQAAENTLQALRAEIEAVQNQITLNVVKDFFNQREIEEYRDSIRDVYDEIDRINGLIDEQTALAASVSPFDAQAIADAAPVFDLVGDRAAKAADILEKLVPNDAKRQELEGFALQLEQALQINAIDEDQFRRGTDAINEQLAKLNENTAAARNAASEARKLQSIIAEALPERTALDEQADKLRTLDAAYARGAINQNLYSLATESLSNQFRTEALEEYEEGIRDITDALSERTQTPFSQYADEVELLNRAILEVQDTNGDLQDNLTRAFANLDFEVRANLTVATGDTLPELERSFADQRAALDEFHDARSVSQAQANADLVALEQSYARRVVDINRGILSELDSLGGLSEGVRLNFEIEGGQLQLERLLEDGRITIAQFQEAERLQAITHQEQLSEIVRRGLGTREQMEQASGLDRFSALLNQNQAEIDFATQVSQSLLDFEQNNRQIRAAAANRQLDDDQARYDEALAAFENNGTEQNRVALAVAEKQLAISEAAAKEQFDREKKYSIAQAVLAQSLTVAQAFADPKLDALQKFTVAASSALAVASAIRSIKATTFESSSGSSLSSSSGVSSSSISANTSDSSSGSAGQNIQVNILNGFFPQQDPDVLIAQSVKRLADDGYILDSQKNQLNTQNIPIRNVTVQ